MGRVWPTWNTNPATRLRWWLSKLSRTNRQRRSKQCSVVILAFPNSLRPTHIAAMDSSTKLPLLGALRSALRLSSTGADQKNAKTERLDGTTKAPSSDDASDHAPRKTKSKSHEALAHGRIR